MATTPLARRGQKAVNSRPGLGRQISERGKHLDTHELKLIRDKLASFDSRCEAIMVLLGSSRHLSRDDRAHAEELYRSLKDDLKRAAAVGAVSGEKRAPSDAEELFYRPAVRAAALALAPAVNSNPITSHWSSALYDAQIEFAHYMPKLEDQ